MGAGLPVLPLQLDEVHEYSDLATSANTKTHDDDTHTRHDVGYYGYGTEMLPLRGGEDSVRAYYSGRSTRHNLFCAAPKSS